MKIIFALIIALLNNSLYANNSNLTLKDDSIKTWISVKYPKHFLNNTTKWITVKGIDYSCYRSSSNPYCLIKKVGIYEDEFNCEIKIGRPIHILIDYFNSILIEPGDSMIIEKKVINENYTVSYSGRGSLKMQCIEQVQELQRKFIGNNRINSLDRLDLLSEITCDIIDSYKLGLSEAAYNIIKADYLPDLGQTIASSLLPKINVQDTLFINWFYKRLNNVRYKIDLSKSSLIHTKYFPAVVKYQFLIKYAIENKIKWEEIYYGFNENIFTALVKQIPDCELKIKTIAYYLRSIIDDYGFDDKIKLCTDLFFGIVDSTNSFRNGIFSLVKIAESNFKKGTTAFDFALPDTAGNIIKLIDFKGKIILIDFMYTGCGGCMQMTRNGLPNVEKAFGNRSDIIFISISITKNIKDVKRGIGIYSTPKSIQLFTGGDGSDSEVIKFYNIHAFPVLVLIDKQGKIISARAPDPRYDKGKGLIDLINKEL